MPREKTKRPFNPYPDENIIHISGRLSSDPDLVMRKARKTLPPIPCSSFTLACNPNPNNPNECDFFNCVGWAAMGQKIHAAFHTGDNVYIIGRVRSAALKVRADDGRPKGEKFLYIIVKRIMLIGHPARDIVAEPMDIPEPAEQEDTGT